MEFTFKEVVRVITMLTIKEMAVTTMSLKTEMSISEVKQNIVLNTPSLK